MFDHHQATSRVEGLRQLRIPDPLAGHGHQHVIVDIGHWQHR